jgi:tetratricopeptide (TPR) repeat protein
MKLTIKIFGLLVFLTVEQIAFGQQDNYAKNTKLFEDEQARFESELKTNMDSAEVYWNHANIIAGFTFNVYKEAWQFYEVALSIDSSKVVYFIDYGKYLSEVMNYVYDAKVLYERGLKNFPSDQELKRALENVNSRIVKIEENKKLSSFGKAPTTGHPKATDYSKVTDFENLVEQTKNVKSEFYFNNLLDKFNADSNLTDEQVYMLLIGFTQQDEYRPYTQEPDEVYKLNNVGNFDEAINKAKELLKDNPLMPSLYKELIYAYRKKGNQTLADISLKKMQSILNAMLYTGDGTCEKPYVAFWVREEYTLLKYLDYKKTGAIYIGTCAGQQADRLEVTNLTTNEQTIICFNITMILKKQRGNK